MSLSQRFQLVSLLFNVSIAMLLSWGGAIHAATVTPLMHENFKALTRLQELAASQADFESSDNQDEIQKQLETLASASKNLPHMLDKERPALAVISSLFIKYIDETGKNFKSGYKEYARNQIKTVSGFCMACHTSGDSANQFNANDNAEALKKMNSYQKAEFYGATRQFDKALAAYEQVVLKETPDSERDVIQMMKAVRSYLSISVRVKQDSTLTYGFLTRVNETGKLDGLFASDIKQWINDSRAWVQEKRFNKEAAAVDVLIRKSESLVKDARKHQLFPADHSGDVNFLRATNYAQAALKKSTKSTERAKAFFVMGQSYAALSDPFLWELDGLYFEACIREVPHTDQSKQCFKHLASNVYLGFSGSSGTHIPVSDLNRLKELRKLAN